MTSIRKSAPVNCSVEQMYHLVNDVHSYPQFVPWCQNSVILNEDRDEIRARLTFSKGGLQKTFTTSNRLSPHKMIEMRLIEGPFHHLEGFWRFESAPMGHCLVSLDLEFEFNSVWVAAAFGPFFNPLANSLVDVFCKRAHELYP